MKDVSGSGSDDSDIEMTEPPKTDANKGKGNNANQEPDQRTLATWRRGDGDMEPSAKMLALIKCLQEAERNGDKTIVYSQCAFQI